MTDVEVKSPCINICELGSDNICTGCFRSLEEIGAWSYAGHEERSQIISNANQRQKLAPDG